MKKAFLFLLCIAILLSGLPGCAKTDEDKIDWENIVLSNVVPPPQSDLMKIISNDKTALHADIHKMSMNQFLEYIRLCEEAGFDIDATRGGSTMFSACNRDGYVLNLTYSDSDDKMTISLVQGTRSDEASPTPETSPSSPTPTPTPTPTKDEVHATSHVWQAATCTTPKTCSICHTTEGTARGHSWQAATCTTPKTCSICKTIEGNALGHSLLDGKCSNCGYVEKTPAEKIYEQCSPAVAYIELYNSKNEVISSGSGFFITPNGSFVTCYHVIDGASSAIVQTKDGKTYRVAGVYAFSKEHDWAVLKVEGTSFAVLKIGAPSEYSAGSDVYAIGSPLGLTDSISTGIISNLNREYKGTTYIQTTASISSGSSGGALINKNGNVIGITAGSFVDGQSLNLAVPMTYVDTSTNNSLKKLSEIERSVTVEDPIQLLKEVLLKYGVVDAIANGSETVVSYSLEIKDASGITHSLTYVLNTGYLFIKKEYSTQFSNISTTLYFDGAGTNEVAAKALFFYHDTVYNKPKSCAAFVYRENVTSASGIEFITWIGGADLSQQAGEILFYRNVLDLIDAADYMFTYYGLPITMKDFGYTY